MDPRQDTTQQQRQLLSPLRLLLVLSLSVFAIEAGVMFILSSASPLPPWQVALIDAASLVVLLFPLLSLTVFRPLVRLNAEREAIDMSLREEIAFSRTLMASLPGVFYRLDPQGRLVDWNETLAALLGSQGIEDAKLNILSILHEADREAVAAKIQEGMEKGYAEVEARLLLADGEVRYYYFIARSLQVKDRTFLLGTGVDIEVRKETEEKLEKSKEAAEAATTAKSEFLANMSHEIRTPLNAILGMAEMLSETPLNEEQFHYVSVFQRAGDALLLLVNDLLDLSKIESGLFELEHQPFDLGELIEDLVALSLPKALDKGLVLRCSIEEGLIRGRLGDPYRLQQIVGNLLSNALKFTPCGEVMIRLEAAHGGEGVRIKVADSGIGISPDQLECIFEKFKQADGSTTRRFGGTGLGLAICRMLAERMSGRVWAESEEGRGSVFYVELPLSAEPAAESLSASRDSAFQLPLASDRALRILLAEDSEDNRAVVSAYLNSTPHELEMAENGQIALERVQAEPFDLILMDLQMPVMDGFVATREIRAWERQVGRPRMPIVAMSAYAMRQEVGRSLEAGCDLHVSKPIKKDTLLATLRQFLGEGEATREHASLRVVVVVRSELERLIPGFLSHREADVLKLREALAAEDMETIRALGHTLAGTGGSYGFQSLTDMGRALEAAAKKSDRFAIDSLISQMDHYLRNLDVRFSQTT